MDYEDSCNGNWGCRWTFWRLISPAHNQDVTFIARGAHLKAMLHNGLKIKSVKHGEFTLDNVQATDKPADVGHVDIVLFCVKTYDTETAEQIIKPIVGKKTVVITLQNGVDSTDKLSAIFGKEHILGGSTYIVSTIAEAGMIDHSTTFATLSFGELDGTITSRAKAFHEVCIESGIEAELTTSIQKVIWEKFLVICAYNGVTSLTRMPIGPIVQDPDTRRLYTECMREIETIAKAKNIGVDPDIIEKQLKRSDIVDPTSTSSMSRDLENGKSIEIEALNGTASRLGRELNISTPINDFIYAALKLHSRGE